MTKEEFLAGIKDIESMEEVMIIVNEGEDIANELHEHDPIISEKVRNVTRAMSELVSYVKSRAESVR